MSKKQKKTPSPPRNLIIRDLILRNPLTGFKDKRKKRAKNPKKVDKENDNA
jgi:hypothetical protein